ncbi:O-antigen polysaccharide polymerase Wzy family protein [Lachnospiraceae bacterium 62-26]
MGDFNRGIMAKKSSYVSQKQLLLLFCAFFFSAVSIAAGVDVMYSLALFLWFLSMIYTVSNLRQRALYFVFLISFFVFLLGGHFCYEYFGMSVNYYFGESFYFHSNLCLFLSLAAVLAGYIFAGKAKLEKKFKRNTNTDERDSMRRRNYSTKNVRQYSKLLFYITYPFWIYTIMGRVSFVLSSSYYLSYVEYESSAPYTVKAIAAMTPYFFYLFLATLPAKKECKLPIVLYLVYALVSLFTGRRSSFMVMILFIVLYFIYRYYRNEEEAWIKRKYIVTAIILGPMLLIILQMIHFIRVGESAAGQSIVELLFGFFQQQGFSSSLLRLERYYEGYICEDTFYSFFGIVKYFRTNSILKIIFNPQYDFSYVGNNIDYAVKGNSLANALSYAALGKVNYLSGQGVGSCYIAELHHDFGYFGVVLGSMVYGIMMKIISKIWNSTYRPNIWTIAIGFAMVESFIKAPRWNYDIFISYFLDLGMWMAFAAVFGLCNVMKRKRHV